MRRPSVRWVPAAYTEAIASARLRCYRPARALAEAGWNSRILTRHLPSRPDVVVFQKAYGPAHLALASRMQRRGAAVVFDLCDNHFYATSDDPRSAERVERLRRMIGLADVVTASTPTLASRIDHPRVVVVDDAIDVAGPALDASPVTRRRLVWFGNAGSEAEHYGMADLGAILHDLSQVAKTVSCELVVVSNSAPAFERYVGGSGLEARYQPWTPASVERALRSADIALLPVQANEFTLCKTANRVVTSLLHGLATVAGRIPSYEEFSPYIRFESWQEHVGAYLADPELRAGDVAGGQAYIADRFPPGHLGEQWAGALEWAVAARAS
ncbi:MAG TPA: hypothetical protein VM388_09870 [Acidimicrobiales bacterium]|nr:hypothetical protein [Acidimicrobiales bacterium]